MCFSLYKIKALSFEIIKTQENGIFESLLFSL